MITSRIHGSAKRFYSSRQSYDKAPPRPKGRVILYASAGAAGAAVLSVADDMKATVEATQRASRVASALFICIKEYVSNRLCLIMQQSPVLIRA